VSHWYELENWHRPPAVVAAALELRERVAAMEAAAASAPLPEPLPDRLIYLTNWIVGFTTGALTRDHAESLARALLTQPETQRVLAPAPMEWPELPVMSPPEGACSESYLAGYCYAWGRARETLAAMNPNRRQEGRNDG
jgi:hypothetical protein